MKSDKWRWGRDCAGRGITAAEVAYVIGNCRPQLNGMRGIYYYTSAALLRDGHYSSHVPSTGLVYILYIIYTDILYTHIYIYREILDFLTERQHFVFPN